MSDPFWLNPIATRAFEGANCFVSGGAGFIGSNLTAALLHAGARVTVFDNLATGRREHLSENPHLRLFEEDIVSSPLVEAEVSSADYIFHLAAQVGNVKSIEEPISDASINILGTLRLLKFARNSSLKRFIYSSSSAIFGEADRLPIDEAHRTVPASFYALSKLTGERYALLAHALWKVPALCLRYFNVYGLPMEDNEYTGVISIFAKALSAGTQLTIYGDGRQTRDFIYVKDVVQALMRSALRGTAGEVYNIGTGKATDVTSLAGVIADILGVRPDISFRPSRAGEVRNSVADIRKAVHKLDYQPQYWITDGIGETVDHGHQGSIRSIDFPGA